MHLNRAGGGGVVGNQDRGLFFCVILGGEERGGDFGWGIEGVLRGGFEG